MYWVVRGKMKGEEGGGSARGTIVFEIVKNNSMTAQQNTFESCLNTHMTRQLPPMTSYTHVIAVENRFAIEQSWIIETVFRSNHWRFPLWSSTRQLPGLFARQWARRPKTFVIVIASTFFTRTLKDYEWRHKDACFLMESWDPGFA